MLLHEPRQTGDDFTNSECPRQRHPQCAAQAVHAARGIFGVVEFAEDLPRPFEKHPAGVGRGATCRVVRKSSFTPSRASRLATIRDIDGCDTPSSRVFQTSTEPDLTLGIRASGGTMLKDTRRTSS